MLTMPATCCARSRFLQGEVADADPADLPLVPQLQHLAQRALETVDRVRPVDLVEVDRLHAQAAQAALALLADARRPQVVVEALRAPVEADRLQPGGAHRLVPAQAALGGHHHPGPAAANGAPDQLLAAPRAVGGGGVDRVDAGVERGPDGVHGLAPRRCRPTSARRCPRPRRPRASARDRSRPAFVCFMGPERKTLRRGQAPAPAVQYLTLGNCILC